MDPTAFSNANHLGEMRELLTGSVRTCQPTVISSLRQLQSVTEAGVARRRRRRTYFRSQRDASNVFENARNSGDSIIGWDTNTGSWDISSARDKRHRVLLPSEMLRNTEKPEVGQTEDVHVKDRTKEGSRTLLTLSENNLMEENSETLIQSAARRRRIDSGLMETSAEKIRENGGGKAFNLIEAPTRAPSQKSIPGRDALPYTNCFLEGWQSASRINGHVAQTEEELVAEVTQDDQKPVMCEGEDTRDGRTISVYPPVAGCGGGGTRRGAFCSTSHGGAQSSQSRETDERVALVPKQTVVKNALLGRESKWSGNDGAEAIYRRLLRIEGHNSQQKMSSLGHLMEEVSHSVRDENRENATSDLPQTGKDFVSEALSTASSDHPDNAKLRQLQLMSPKKNLRGRKIQKGESGGDDEVLSAETCYESEQSKVALRHLEGQSQRDNDAGTSDRGAVNCGSLPILPLHGKHSTEKQFSHPLSRDRICCAPATKLQITERCSKNDWFKEHETCTRAALIHPQDTLCTLARGKNREEEGAEHVTERVGDLEADSENMTSTAHSDVGTGQEKCVAKAPCEGEERPEECIMTNGALPLSCNGKKESRNAPLAMDTPNLHSAGKGSPGLLSGQADEDAPASVCLYYHVQEASPRPRKRLPMHNAAEMTEQPNRLYPIVKGVSRDNAKRRWAVYWKGSRRYFYDKLNENCYHAYQQAVNFRKYSYIQHASRGKNFSVAKVAPGYRREKSPLKQLGSVSIDAASSAKAGPTFNYHTETVSLNETVHPSSQLPCESEKSSIQDSPQNLSSPMKEAVALVPDSQNQASEGEALITGQAKSSSPSLVRTYQFDRKKSVEPADDEAAGESSPLNQGSREGLPADCVMNMYKTALLMVLQDLKASLTGLSTPPAPPSFPYTESSSDSFQECGNDLQSTNCSTPSCQLKSSSSNSQSSGSAQNTDLQNAEPDLRLRPFLLLVVDWHLETVKLASQRRELQPLLAVFSPCFQHLLLPRDAPRPLQQKIYRELMELHTMQALSHLANA